jgi:hypothetical protein
MRTLSSEFGVFVFYPLLSIFAFLCVPSYVHGALLYFDPSEASIFRGDTVTLGLRIDTDENECINTVDAVITYGEGVRAVDVSRGDSILSIWVEDPVINEAERTITFAGGIPGGYCKRALGDPSLTNIIAKIVFRSPGFAVGVGESPSAKITVGSESRVLLHDGLGTEAILRTQDAVVSLLPGAGPEGSDSWRDEVVNDVVPPSDFSITLTQDETAFSKKYFIVWNSQDKQSGIDHYEVMEEPLEDLYSFTWGRADAPWKTVESPYVLVDQTLNSTLRVKAIDKAGNETIAVLVPDAAIRSFSINRIVTYSVATGLAVVALVAIVFILLRRKKQIEGIYE